MQPANYCEDYPVTNYTMEVGGVVTISESLDEVQFLSVENSITADNLWRTLMNLEYSVTLSLVLMLVDVRWCSFVN